MDTDTTSSSEKPNGEEKPTKAEEAKADEKKADEKKADEKPAKTEKSEAKAEKSDEPEERDDRRAKRKGKKDVEVAIRLKRLIKRFGAKTAVDDVSLEIKAGQVYGLIGPNGAGKTTSFSMMAGYLQPTEGFVEILGFAPDRVDELKGRLGVLPQDAILPPTDKVSEFLIHMARLQGIPADKAATQAREVLEEVNGREWWDMKCNQLSHGMAKRVSLAQALLGEPEVVLLDEPTAGLDPRVAYEVRQLIKGRKGRATIVISSHNLQELEEICDAAAILDHGRLVESGTMNKLTGASNEVHVRLGRPRGGAAAITEASLPIAEIKAIPGIKRVEFDDERLDLGIFFDRSNTDAEAVIGQVLWILLNRQMRISGVSKGRGLEARVMDLTDE
jgi:ABC-type multidrug transport system ATPase subunit